MGDCGLAEFVALRTLHLGDVTAFGWRTHEFRTLVARGSDAGRLTNSTRRATVGARYRAVDEAFVVPVASSGGGLSLAG